MPKIWIGQQFHKILREESTNRKILNFSCKKMHYSLITITSWACSLVKTLSITTVSWFLERQWCLRLSTHALTPAKIFLCCDLFLFSLNSLTKCQPFPLYFLEGSKSDLSLGCLDNLCCFMCCTNGGHKCLHGCVAWAIQRSLTCGWTLRLRQRSWEFSIVTNFDYATLLSKLHYWMLSSLFIATKLAYLFRVSDSSRDTPQAKFYFEDFSIKGV